MNICVIYERFHDLLIRRGSNFLAKLLLLALRILTPLIRQNPDQFFRINLIDP